MTERALADAVAVYHELGWHTLSVEQLPTAPLGTPEQRRRARAGCASGEWEVFEQLDEEQWGHRNLLGDIESRCFVLFAIRMGIDVRRAAVIVDRGNIPDDVLVAVLLERGPVFCAQFVDRASTPRRRWGVWDPSIVGGATVRVVAALDLPIPDNIEYLRDWAGCAYMALTPQGPGSTFQAENWLTIPSEHVVIGRFAEHVRAAVAAGVQMTGPLLPTCQIGLERGLIGRDELVDLAFAGLDQAQRPSDRAAWVALVKDDLAITDAEIVDRAEELIPALATGALHTVDTLGLVLIAKAPEDLLPDLVATALPAVTSRRQRTSIVEALATRPRPDPSAAQTISDILTTFDAKAIAPKALAALTTAWSIDTVQPAPPLEVLAPWRPTSPVWSVPRFESGSATHDTMIDAVRVLVSGPQEIQVVSREAERVLSLVIACAAIDTEGTRAALRGVHWTMAPGLRWLRPWAEQQDQFTSGWTERSLSGMREMVVVQRAGEIPCLLSTPSWDDLRIDASDLAARLDRYSAAGAAVCETDLVLALARVDPSTLTDELRTRLRSCTARVVASQQDEHGTAGRWISLWLDEPIAEPALVNQGGVLGWQPEPLVIPPGLRPVFPVLVDREITTPFPCPDFWEFPGWGDAVMTGVGRTWGGAAGQGMLLRQLARSDRPLPPGAAVNLLAAQREPHPSAAADTQQAVLEAFDRGILRPGVADVRYLDWRDEPRSLAAFGRAMGELAQAGLLSVVWPVLDDLIALSAAAPAVLAGTEVLVDVVETLLPSVRTAVDTGLADATVLDLAGMRTLSGRPGSGRAVKTARALVSALPAASAPAVAAAPTRHELPFEFWWPVDTRDVREIDDRSTFQVQPASFYGGPQGLEISVTYEQWPHRWFTLPGQAGWALHTWGRATCFEDAADFAAHEIGWDAAAGRMVTLTDSEVLDALAHDAPPGGEHPPLSTSLVAVVLAGIHNRNAPHVSDMVRHRQFGAAAIETVLPTFFASPDVDPGRLVDVLKTAPGALPVFWPVVTASVRRAGAIDGPLPRWVNPVLMTALQVASPLAEAVRRGLAPERATQWQGLDQIAARPGKSAAVVKARELQDLIRSESV